MADDQLLSRRDLLALPGAGALASSLPVRRLLAEGESRATDALPFAFARCATVGELRACQRARGNGLVCAFPDGSKPLDDAVAGRRFAGVPW